MKWVASGLGIVTMWLWFMPWVILGDGSSSEFYFYQSGQHIGGVAYLLLGFGTAYAFFSWLDVRGGRILVSLGGLLIALGYLVQVGRGVAWGLLGLCLVQCLSLGLALLKPRSST
jgi:hypothetical protein